MKLYAARDKNTNKFVCDITNPGHSFWKRKGACEQAIVKYNSRRYKRGNYDLEMVELICIENEEYKKLKEIEYMYNDLCK